MINLMVWVCKQGKSVITGNLPSCYIGMTFADYRVPDFVCKPGMSSIR